MKVEAEGEIGGLLQIWRWCWRLGKPAGCNGLVRPMGNVLPAKCISVEGKIEVSAASAGEAEVKAEKESSSVESC